MAKKAIDYEFKARNHIDYVIMLNLHAENKFLKRIFEASVKQFEKKRRGQKIKGDINLIKKFKIDKQFFPLLNNVLKKTIKDIKKQVGADKIILINWKTESAFFQRDPKDDWDIKIKIGGHYVDKR